MIPNLAQNTIKFMERVQLSGAEVPAYIECIRALSNDMNASSVQAKFDAAVDAHDTQSGVVKPPDQFKGD